MWPNAVRALMILAASNIVNAQTATMETPPHAGAIATFGQTQSHFRPLTQSQRTEAYLKGFYSPFGFLATGSAAGTAPWTDPPQEWGQGPEGYGHRYASSDGGKMVARTLTGGM